MKSVPMIERTVAVRIPNGKIRRVNRFDYNLAACVKSDRYIQLTDTSWIRASLLQHVREPRDKRAGE